MELRRFQVKTTQSSFWREKTSRATSVTKLMRFECKHCLHYFDEAIVETWSLKIACYFYTDISADLNGHFGGSARWISDCRVRSFWKIVPVSHTKFVQFVKNQNIQRPSFSAQGCSDDKNWLDFSNIFFKICRFRSSVLLSINQSINQSINFI